MRVRPRSFWRCRALDAFVGGGGLGALAARLIVALVLGAVLAPTPFTKATWADDWADETAPTDNPQTPGPDVYPNKRIEDGVVSMPNLVQIAPALPSVELFFVPAAALFFGFGRPPVVEVVVDLASAPRAPPGPCAA